MAQSNEQNPEHLKPWMYALSAASLVMGIIAISVMLAYARFHRQPVVKSGQQVTLNIPRGASWSSIKTILKRQGVVRSSLFFELWARQQNLPSQVKAGVYVLKGPMMLPDLQNTLKKGGTQQGVKVVVPEGFTIFHIADRLEHLKVVSKKDFLAAARDPKLLTELDIPGESVEGYIFPDTYFVERGTSAQAIIRRMHKQFKARWAAIIKKHPTALAKLERAYKFDKHDVVIMASIVERETNHDPERDLVSQVFYNRLTKKMKLQTDPTCVYNARRYNKIPKPADCKDRLNRYSTYVIKGMPPGPISSPGAASLEAALVPNGSAKAKKYLFFVAKRDGTGAHYFSETYAEHRRAIKKYLQ